MSQMISNFISLIQGYFLNEEQTAFIMKGGCPLSCYHLRTAGINEEMRRENEPSF